MGSQIVGRAFVQAYKQAAANAGKQGASRASATGSGQSPASAVNDLTRKTGMTLEEALQILNVDRDAAPQQIQKVRIDSGRIAYPLMSAELRPSFQS